MINNICLICEEKYTYHSPGKTASKVLSKYFNNIKILNNIPHDLEYYLKINNFDTVIFLNVPTLRPSIYEISRILKTINVGVYFDDSAQYFLNWFRYLTQVIDFALCWEPVDVSLFESYGVPAAHIPGLFVTYSDEILSHSHTDWYSRSIDCIHIGRMDRPGRNSLQSVIESNFANSEFWGDGTLNGYIKNSHYVDKLFNSKIAINNSGCAKYNFVRKSDCIEWGRRQYKGKLYHYFLSGCTVLTQDSPLLENYFTDGEDLIIYKSNQDLISKLKFLLHNQEFSHNIATSGHKKALSHICEKKIINDFTNILKKALVKKVNRHVNDVYIDKYYARSIAAFAGNEIIYSWNDFIFFIRTIKIFILDIKLQKILFRKLLKKFLYE